MILIKQIPIERMRAGVELQINILLTTNMHPFK